MMLSKWFKTSFISKAIRFGFVLLPLFSIAQIDTKIDTAHIKIGEPIQYTLSVQLKDKSQLRMPVIGDTLSKHIEILDRKLDTLSDGNGKKIVQHLTLTAYDPGEYLIRSLPVLIDKDTLLSHSFQIQVDDVKIDSANLGGFPIKPIMEESYSWKDYLRKYRFELIMLLLLIVAGAAVWWWRKQMKNKNENKIQPVKTPYEEAMDALMNLDQKKYISKNQVKPYYSDLSFLLRRYLGRRFNFSSLELLSDDLVNHFRNSDELSTTEIENLKQFLFDSDLVKYAKATPNEDRHDFYRKWAEQLIEKTKPVEIPEDDENNLKNEKK